MLSTTLIFAPGASACDISRTDSFAHPRAAETLGSVRSFCADGNANVPYTRIHATSLQESRDVLDVRIFSLPRVAPVGGLKSILNLVCYLFVGVNEHIRRNKTGRPETYS